MRTRMGAYDQRDGDVGKAHTWKEYEEKKESEQSQESKKTKGGNEAEEDEKNGKGKWRKKG